MDLLEKGCVRFWTQVEKCTSDCQVEYVFNDVIVTQGKVGIQSNLSYYNVFISATQLMHVDFFLVFPEIHNEL